MYVTMNIIILLTSCTLITIFILWLDQINEGDDGRLVFTPFLCPGG